MILTWLQRTSRKLILLKLPPLVMSVLRPVSKSLGRGLQWFGPDIVIEEVSLGTTSEDEPRHNLTLSVDPFMELFTSRFKISRIKHTKEGALLEVSFTKIIDKTN
jgi:hypothetical protein